MFVHLSSQNLFTYWGLVIWTMVSSVGLALKRLKSRFHLLSKRFPGKQLLVFSGPWMWMKVSSYTNAPPPPPPLDGLSSHRWVKCRNFVFSLREFSYKYCRMDAGTADQLNMFVCGTEAVLGLHSSEEACSEHPEHSLYCVSCLLSARLLIVHGYLQWSSNGELTPTLVY